MRRSGGATQRDESASSKQDVTAAASVQSAAAFNDLSGEQLSVHDYLYINSWVSWQSAVTSSDLHGMIIVPPRIQDDDIIEIDAKLENKHCCVFIWQMNFIRRKLKVCREPASHRTVMLSVFSFWEANSVKVHNYHLLWRDKNRKKQKSFLNIMIIVDTDVTRHHNRAAISNQKAFCDLFVMSLVEMIISGTQVSLNKHLEVWSCDLCWVLNQTNTFFHVENRICRLQPHQDSVCHIFHLFIKRL